MFVCLSGHIAIRKACKGKKNVGTNQVNTYYFDVEKCKSYPLKNGCYKDCAKTKKYLLTIKSTIHQQQLIFQETEHYLQN